MSPKQLETRLVRIRKLEKLAKFAAVALEFAERFPKKSERYFDLAKRAEAKLEGELYPGQQYEFNFSDIRRLGAIILLLAGMWLAPTDAQDVCSKANILNPITDVCWQCVSPIKIAGLTTVPGPNENNYKDFASTPIHLLTSSPP